MITVAIFNIIVILFAYLGQQERKEFWLKGSFVMIFLFLALRYDYGNDYHGYLEKFLEINRMATIDYFDVYWAFEPGWILLCRLFKSLGFFVMIAFLALFNCVVYYRFIKKHVPPMYYWLAVFIYVFNPGLMLIHSSAMRQSLAISLFLLSIDYIFKKDVLRYLLCIALASLFHRSALVLLPVFLLGLINWKINKFTAICILICFIFMFQFAKNFLPEINQFIIIYFNRYETYQGGTEIGTGLGLVFNSIIFALILFYERFQNKEISILFKIVIISYLIIPFGLSLMMLGRVGMYFQAAMIAVFPIVFLNIKNRIYRNLILSMFILITLYTFIIFFQSDIWRESFGIYKTILSAPALY